MEKSPDAFRTISEVSEALDTPAHVLRFWETRFTQVKPVKRAGGRRYYRPSDVALLAGIKKLLHEDGMTIRGVQKLLREQGIRHVAALAAPSEEPSGETIDSTVAPEAPMILDAPIEPETAPQDNVVPLAARKAEAPEAPPAEAPAATPAGGEATAEPPADTPATSEAARITAPPPAESPAAPQGDLFAEPAAPEAPQPPSSTPAPDWPSHPLTRAESAALTGSEAPAETEEPPLANRLRALSRRPAPGQAERIAALRDRLAALRDSLATRVGRSHR